MSSVTLSDIAISLSFVGSLALVIYMIFHSLDLAIAIVYTTAGVGVLSLIGCFLCHRFDMYPTMTAILSDAAMGFGAGGALLALFYLSVN